MINEEDWKNMGDIAVTAYSICLHDVKRIIKELNSVRENQ
jgi:hypothetical protein